MAEIAGPLVISIASGITLAIVIKNSFNATGTDDEAAPAIQTHQDERNYAAAQTRIRHPADMAHRADSMGAPATKAKAYQPAYDLREFNGAPRAVSWAYSDYMLANIPNTPF